MNILYEMKNIRKQLATTIIPSLSNAQVSGKKKGFDGCIGIIGGSREYTGAPYFAGISAFRTGADLVHVFCHPEASAVIKSYSPELIVHPSLIALNEESIETSAQSIAKFFSRINVMVIGPGLGRYSKEKLEFTSFYRDEGQLCITRRIIELAKLQKIPLILDADALFLIQKEPELIKGYKNCILTPNANEFKRLLDSRMIDVSADNAPQAYVESLGGVTIIVKGSSDLIANATHTLECKTIGSARRIGGQGDILAGCLGTLLCWSLAGAKNMEIPLDPYLLASFGACDLVKTAASKTFAIHGRSMLTSHMISNIGEAFDEIFQKL